MRNEIVLYKPNEQFQLEVQLKDDTVWLTQEQIATLFGTQRPAITKHLNNIYKSGELEEQGTCSILERMGNDGKQRYQTKYYNLDAILSVGYRVNSRNATLFRKWAKTNKMEIDMKQEIRQRRGWPHQWLQVAMLVFVLLLVGPPHGWDGLFLSLLTDKWRDCGKVFVTLHAR